MPLRWSNPDSSLKIGEFLNFEPTADCADEQSHYSLGVRALCIGHCALGVRLWRWALARPRPVEGRRRFGRRRLSIGVPPSLRFGRDHVSACTPKLSVAGWAFDVSVGRFPLPQSFDSQFHPPFPLVTATPLIYNCAPPPQPRLQISTLILNAVRRRPIPRFTIHDSRFTSTSVLRSRSSSFPAARSLGEAGRRTKINSQRRVLR